LISLQDKIFKNGGFNAVVFLTGFSDNVNNITDAYGNNTKGRGFMPDLQVLN